MGVKERYEEPKRKRAGLGVKERYELNKQIRNTNYEVSDEFIDSFIKDANDFITSAETEYNGLGWSNASSSYSDRAKKWIDIYSKSSAIRKWLGSNKNRLDNESYKSISDALNNIEYGTKSVVDSFKNAKDFYSQFATEDEYDVWHQKEEEKQAVLNAEDFDYYSQLGKYVQNPTWGESFAPVDIFGWKPFGDGATVNNLVTFAEKNSVQAYAEGGNAVNGGGSSGDRTQLINLINTYMEDDEKAIYNYYIGRGDTEKANEYMSQLEDVFRQREAGKIVKHADNNALELVFSAAAGIDNWFSGMKNLDNYVKGENADHTTSMQYAQGMMGSNNTGIWKATNDLSNTIGNMLPSILTSFAVTGLTGSLKAGEVVGSFTLGASATGNAYAEMKNLGYTDKQSRNYATLIGASEAGLQYLLGGIGDLGGVLTKGAVSTFVSSLDNALAKLAINATIKASGEALEEGLQTVLEPIFKTWITGEQYDAASLEDVLYSALLGALSSGMLDGVPSAINTGISNIKAKEVYGDGSELVAEAYDINPDNEYVNKLKALVDGGKSLSGEQINKLVGINEEALYNQDISKIKSGTESRLNELGETGDTSKIAEVIAKKAAGDKLTFSEKAILKKSDFGRSVADELNTKKLDSNDTMNRWAEEIGTERINAEQYNPKEIKTASKEDVETKYKISRSGATSLGGKNVSIQAVESVKNGEVTLRLENGDTVEADEVEFGSSQEALIYATVSMLDATPASVNSIVADLKTLDADQLALYQKSVPLAYLYGKINYEKGLANLDMPEQIKKSIYTRGRIDAMIEADSKTPNKTEGNQKPTVEKKSGIIFEDGVTYKEADASDIQKASMAHIQIIDQVSNLEVHVFESKMENGKRVAYIDGKRELAPNGFFRDGNKIYIDLNSGDGGEGAMLYTISHEIGHYIREWNAKGFKKLGDFLVEQYGENGVSVEELLERQRKKKKGRYVREGKPLPSDAELSDMAYEEMVCDAMSDMFTDPQAYEKLIELKQKNKSLWERLGEAIKKVLDKIKAALGIYKSKDVAVAKEAEYVRDFAPEVYNKLQDLYIKAFVEADENYNPKANQSETKLSDRDSEYLDAVNRGDMETAQRMVDEAAREAGYTERAYHGTNAFGFTKIDLSKSDDGISFFATDSIATGKTYSALGKTIRISDAADGLSNENREIIESEIDSLIFDVTEYLCSNLGVRDWVESDYFDEDISEVYRKLEYGYEANEEINSFLYKLDEVFNDFLAYYYKDYYIDNPYLSEDEKLDWDTFNMTQEAEEFADYYYSKKEQIKTKLKGLGKNANPGVYDFYVNADNHFAIECYDSMWDNIQNSTLPDITSEKYKKYGYRGHRTSWTTRSVAAYAKDLGYRGVTFKNIRDTANGQYVTPATVYTFFYPREQVKSADTVTYDDNGNVIPLSERFNPQNSDIRYSDRVTDEETLDFLENQEHVTVYRAMQVIDGKLYPPMNAYTKDETGKKVLMPPSEIGEWEQAVERPDLIDPKTGKFKLNKGKVDDGKRGTIIPAAYNPYIHTSASPLNDQFSSAYKRSNLVVVEGEIPVSELTSGYRAKFAKDTVGETKWHSGPIAGKLKGEKARRVFLSRWFKPVRIVPDSEVASMVAKTLEGENIDVPYNVVTPSLRTELEKVGVSIQYSERGTDTISNRTLLANALESVAQNEAERKKLQKYKTKIALLDQAQNRATRIRNAIRQIDETKSENAKIKLQNYRETLKQIEAEISGYDAELLNLEATTPLREVLKREKQKAYEAARERGNEIVKEQQEYYRKIIKKNAEGRNKTAVKNKIKKALKRLDGILNRGTKKRNVKEGLRDTVATTLALGELLFNSDISNADIVRYGVDSVTEKESKMLNDYRDLLDKKESNLSNIKALRDGMSDNAKEAQSAIEVIDHLAAENAKIDSKLSYLNQRLADLFERERARISKVPVTSLLEHLEAEYKKLENSDVGYIKASYDPLCVEKIQACKDDLGGVLARDMSVKQLEKLYETVRLIEHTITTANKEFRNGKYVDLEERATRISSELSSFGNQKVENLALVETLKGYIWNEMTPYSAFDTIGSETLKEYYNDLLKGQDVVARDAIEAKEFAEKAREKYNYKSWNLDQKFDFKLVDGRTFTTTLKHLMSIYAYSKREQAQKHMSEGGFFHNDKTSFRRGKNGILEYKRTDSVGYKVDDIVLLKIKDALGKEKMGYVDEMQQYLTDMGKKGNEVSRVLWGIDTFKEENYFPLKSKEAFLKVENAATDKHSLKNDSMTKETVPNASNPIILDAFDDVWAKHVNKMATFHGLVIPIENLNKVLQWGTWTNGADSTTIETTIAGKFGTGATTYLNQFIDDLNGGISAKGVKTPGIDMFGKFKKTAVGFSLSTIVQQPTAVVRAMSEINPKYFVGKMDLRNIHEVTKEIQQYAPIAIIKEIGGFDAGGSGQIERWLNNGTLRGATKVFDTIDDISMKGAEVADQVGWAMIWDAVKRENVKKSKYGINSPKFLEECGERFTEVITKTQVYDSVLSRSAYMRSKTDLMKMMTAFMGEPTLSINMIWNAVVKATRGGKEAKIQAAKTIGYVYAASILASALSSVVYALRDDDDDESYAEKYFSSLGNELASDILLLPIVSLPVLKDIVSICQGWNVERSDMSIFNDLIDAVRAVTSERKSTYRKIEDLAGAIAALFGIPLKNLLRTGRELYNLVENLFDSESGGDIGKALGEGILGK